MIEIQDSDERKQGLNSKDEQESQLLTKEGEFIVTSKDDVIEED
jgi:hypothetical protein